MTSKKNDILEHKRIEREAFDGFAQILLEHNIVELDSCGSTKKLVCNSRIKIPEEIEKIIRYINIFWKESAEKAGK